MASVTRKPKIFKKGATPPNLLSTYGAMSPSRKMVNDLRTHLRNAQPAPQQPRGGPRLRESASDPGMAYLGVGGRREARQADEEDDLGPLEFAQLEEVLDEAEHLWRERHHEAERRRQRAVAVTVAKYRRAVEAHGTIVGPPRAADLFDEDATAATRATRRSRASAASSAARSVATAASPRTLPSLGNTSVAGLSASPSRRPRVADTRPRERPKMSTSGLGDMLSERRSAAQRATKDRALRAALRSGEGIDVAARGPIDTYVASFAREKEIFASGSVYALAKLDEATQLASTGLMPTCVLAAVAVHLLLEELPSLGHVRRPLAALVRAIFAIPQAHHALIAGDTEAAAAYRGKTKRRRSLFVASEIAQELMDLRGGAAQDNLDTCATARQRYLGGVLAQYLAKITDDAGGDGGDADRPELRLMAHVPTWGELRSLFEARRNAELSTKASVETRLSKLVREKEQVVQFVEGLCDKRSVTAMAITFERWRTHKKQEKRKAALARALLAMQANGGAIDAPRSLFTAWRRAVVAATQRRARQRARDVARVVRESREALDCEGDLYAGEVGELERIRQAQADADAELAELEAAMALPELNAASLDRATGALAASLGDAYEALGALARSATLDAADEREPRLSSCFDANMFGDQDFCDRHRERMSDRVADDKISADLRAWSPGTEAPRPSVGATSGGPRADDDEGEGLDRSTKRVRRGGTMQLKKKDKSGRTIVAFAHDEASRDRLQSVETGPDPFTVRVGRELLAWADATLVRDGSALDDDDGHVDADRGVIGAFADGVKLGRLARRLFADHYELDEHHGGLGEDWLKRARAAAALCSVPPGGQDKERGANVACALELLRGGAFLHPPLGRFVEVRHLAGAQASAAHWSLLPHAPKGKPRGAAAAPKKAGGAKGGAPRPETVVKVVSKYLGKRVAVDPETTAVGRTFALLAQLFSTQFYRYGPPPPYCGHHHPYEPPYAASALKGRQAAEDKHHSRHANAVHAMETALHAARDALYDECAEGGAPAPVPVPPPNHRAPRLGDEAARATCCDVVVVKALAIARTGVLALAEAETVALADAVEAAHDAAQRQLAGTWAAAAAARRDRRAARAARDDALRLAWRANCTTVLAQRVRVEEDVDDGVFTRPRRAQIEADLRRFGYGDGGRKAGAAAGDGAGDDDGDGDEPPADNMEEELAQIHLVLRDHLRDMRRIFPFYAAAGGGCANTMDSAEFWKFVHDSRLQDDKRRLLPSSKVDLLFQQASLDFSKTGSDRLEQDTHELDKTQFSECLVRLACARYPKARSPSDCLSHVLKEHVLPHACQIDADVFRERLHSDVVRSVQLKHRKNLKTVFKVFASWDSASPASTMDADEMVVMLRFAKVIGPLCSEMACRTIFAYVQNDDVVIQDLKTDGTVGSHRNRSRDVVELPGSDVEMVFTEFEECLAAVAQMLQPDPYKMLDQSIEAFLGTQFLPALAQHPKLRGQVELPEQIEDKRGAFTPRGGFGPAGAFAGGFTPRGAPSADVDAGDGGADSPTQGLRRTAAGMKLKVPPRR